MNQTAYQKNQATAKMATRCICVFTTRCICVLLIPRESVKCLGYWWSWDLSLTKSIQEGIAKARRAFFAFGALGAFNGKLNPLSGRAIYETCVIPVLLYGCENWIMTKRCFNRSGRDFTARMTFRRHLKAVARQRKSPSQSPHVLGELDNSLLRQTHYPSPPIFLSLSLPLSLSLSPSLSLSLSPSPSTSPPLSLSLYSLSLSFDLGCDLCYQERNSKRLVSVINSLSLPLYQARNSKHLVSGINSLSLSLSLSGKK